MGKQVNIQFTKEFIVSADKKQTTCKECIQKCKKDQLEYDTLRENNQELPEKTFEFKKWGKMNPDAMKNHLFNNHLPIYKIKIASKLAAQTPAKENQQLLTNFFGSAKDR